MICPACGHDNIAGVDTCETCGVPLVELDHPGSELEQSIQRHSINVLPTKEPIVVSPETTVRKAIDLMMDEGVGCVMISKQDQISGIFTERDVLNRISQDLNQLDKPVSEFMTKNLETVTHEDSIAYVLQAMDLGGYRHMPIVDAKRKPLGIISIRDILRFLCIRFAEIRTS